MQNNFNEEVEEIFFSAENSYCFHIFGIQESSKSKKKNPSKNKAFEENFHEYNYILYFIFHY